MTDVDHMDQRSVIAALNDAFRRAGPNGDWFATAGLHALGAAFVTAARARVMKYDGFNADNDPHGEHDFGDFVLAGVRVWFKIDYYDRSLSWGSPDPRDPHVTRRVLTLMLPEDY